MGLILGEVDFTYKWLFRVDIDWEVFNKSPSIPIGTCFFWFIYTLPFETSGTALCRTTGRSISMFVSCPEISAYL